MTPNEQPGTVPQSPEVGSLVEPLLMVAAALVALLIVAQPERHQPRLAATFGCAGIGLLGARAFQKRRWRLCGLGSLVAGAGLATACYWFVPSRDGLSLWEAHQRIAALEGVAAGDGDFAASYKDAVSVAGIFPSLAGRVSRAEAAWVESTAAGGLAEAAQLREKKPAEALARLRAVEKQLAAHAGSSFSRVKQRLHGGCADIVRARLRSAGREIDRLLARGEFAAVLERVEALRREWHNEARAARLQGSLTQLTTRATLEAVKGAVKEALGQKDARAGFECLRRVAPHRDTVVRVQGASQALRQGRRDLLRKALATARGRCRELVVEGRFGGLAPLEKRLAAEWSLEAKAVGLEVELERLRQQVLFLSELAAAARPAGPGEEGH
jgi:hypothetical protein